MHSAMYVWKLCFAASATEAMAVMQFSLMIEQPEYSKPKSFCNVSFKNGTISPSHKPSMKLVIAAAVWETTRGTGSSKY